MAFAAAIIIVCSVECDVLLYILCNLSHILLYPFNAFLLWGALHCSQLHVVGIMRYHDVYHVYLKYTNVYLYLLTTNQLHVVGIMRYHDVYHVYLKYTNVYLYLLTTNQILLVLSCVTYQ